MFLITWNRIIHSPIPEAHGGVPTDEVTERLLNLAEKTQTAFRSPPRYKQMPLKFPLRFLVLRGLEMPRTPLLDPTSLSLAGRVTWVPRQKQPPPPQDHHRALGTFLL